MLREENGLVYKELCIDPHRKPVQEKVLFSHAHSDHVKLHKDKSFIATPETIELIKTRYPKKAEGKPFESLKFNTKKKFDGFEIELKENGHLLGSSQIIIDGDGRNVITSDFRLDDSLIFKGAKPISADTLVLETTFGSPEYNFPKQEELVPEMISWIKQSAKKGLVLLSGYALGKAQELTAIANEAGFTPLAHDSIYDLNSVYKKNGVKLGNFEKLDHNLKDFQVLLMPPQLVDRHLFSTIEHFDKRKVHSAVASGWEYRGYFDKTFPLSNHADYNGLIEYVKASDPKLVLTDHGFCEEFARKLNRLGFNAKPLKQHKQRVIGDY